MHKSTPATESYFWLYLSVITLSLLFTGLELTTHNPIELDSLLYLKSAEMFNLSGYTAATEIYPWPFFSIIIASVNKIFHLSYLHSGYLVNTVLQALISVNFIRLVNALGGNKRVVYIAAAVIIFYPYLNKIRPYITRDFGYWAFALWGLLSLIRYHQQAHWRHILMWNSMMGIAALFRIEGAIFLLFGPLIYILPATSQPVSNRLLHLAKLYSPLLLVVVAGLSWKLHHQTVQHPNALGRIPELGNAIQQGLHIAWQNIAAKAAIIGQQVLNKISIDDTYLFLTGGLAGLFIGVIFKTLNPVYILLSGYGIRYRLLPADSFIHYLLGYFILLNILMLSIFLAQQFFIVDRYVVLLNLLLMLWVPFSMEQLFLQWQTANRKQQIATSLLVLACFGFAVGGLVRFGYSKAYMTEAGNWIKHHTPSTATLYSNSPQLLFYAQRNDLRGAVYFLNPPELNTLTLKELKAYDYIAIWQTKKDREQHLNSIPANDLILIKTFKNNRGDAIFIFKSGA